MDLINFSSFFEIFAALNLGYAGFEYFRDLLNINTSKISKDLSFNKLEESRIKINLLSAENGLEGVDKVLKVAHGKLKAAKLILDDEYETLQKFLFEKFKPISLIYSFYCITALLVAAFQAKVISPGVEPYDFTLFLFSLALVTSSYSFIIFFSSLSKRVLYYKVKISVLSTSLLYFFAITLSYIIVNFSQIFSPIHIIVISVFLPIAIYIIITSIIFLRKNEFIDETKKYISKEKWNSIIPKKNSLKLAIIFIVSLLVFIIPIYIYFSKTNENLESIILNTIILINPILLYVFLSFRVYLYQTNYSRKFLKLYKDYAPKFESIEKWSEEA